MDAPMTELISARMESWIPVFISLAGLCALLVQARFGRRIQTGPAPLILALAWPLWQLFRWLDDRYDTTSVVGMTIPYLLFIVIWLVIGFGFRPRASRSSASGVVEQQSEGPQIDPGAVVE